MLHAHLSIAAIRFEPLINSLALFALLALSGFVLLRLQRRSTAGVKKTPRRILNTLRAISILLIAFALLNPVSVKYAWIDKPAKIAVLVDNSQSMQFPALLEDTTRATAALNILDGHNSQDGLIEKIKRIAELDVYSFAAHPKIITSPDELTFDQPQTNFLSALTPLAPADNKTASSYQAAIIISDGTDTKDHDAQQLASEFNALGIQVHAIGVGSSDTKDTAITHLFATRTTRKDTLVKLHLTLGAHNITRAPQTISVTDITDASGRIELARRNTEIYLGGTKETLEFLPRETGFRIYEVKLSPASGEKITENNTRIFGLSVVRRKIKVLYMEGSEYRRPMRTLWEHQYLEDALTEDGDIEVKTLLRKNQSAARAAGVSLVTSKTDGYPKTRSELFKYDVIISSDIDIDFFSEEQLKNTVDFVSKHGGGFIMIGGWTAFGAGGYDESVMDKMLPVDMMGRKNEHLEENEDFAVVLTPEGRLHPIMQLVPDENKSASLWEFCPTFHGHNRVKRAKPAAVTLLEHDGSGKGGENLYGRDVILAVQQYGNGRSMAFTTDTTAGWGTEFEESFGEDGDNRHYKTFWRNAIRWLAAYRLDAPQSRTKILLDDTQHAHNTPLDVDIQVLGQNYTPSENAKVTLKISAPNSTTQNLIAPLTTHKTQPLYRTTFTPKQIGLYKIRAAATIDGVDAGMDQIAIDTSHSPAEFAHINARETLLQNIASTCGGSFYRADDANKLYEQLVDLVSSARKETKTTLWDTPTLLALIILALILEWAIRKKSGLA